MILNRAFGNLLTWTRTTKWALTTIIAFICLSLAGCSQVQTPPPSQPDTSTRYAVVALLDSVEDYYLRGVEYQENNNDKEAARHFLEVIKLADGIDLQYVRKSLSPHADRIWDAPITPFSLSEIAEQSEMAAGIGKLERDFFLAIKGNLAMAQHKLGTMYAHGKMLPSDVDEEINQINKEVDSHLHAKTKEIGKYPSPNLSDNDKRMHGLYVLATKNDPEAQNHLGVFFRDHSKSVNARLKNLNPSNRCKENLRNSVPDGFAQMALYWFQEAADQGNIAAANNLGLVYLDDFVSDDQSSALLRCQKALHFFRQAAQNHDPGALYNLGFMYEYGHGLRKNNFREAMRYYHLGAELGDPSSQFSLAEKYIFMHKKTREGLRTDPKHGALIQSLEKRMGDYTNAPELTESEAYILFWFWAFEDTCNTARPGSGESDSCNNIQARDTYKAYQELLGSIPIPISGSGWFEKTELNKTGTGFVVHSENTDVEDHTYILTNAHVVTPDWKDGRPHWENMNEDPDCSQVRIVFEKSAFPVFSPAEVVERSPHHDLALLKVKDVAERASVTFRPENTKLVLGEKSYAFGYPHSRRLSFEMHATEGNVSATAGLFSDPSTFETESPIRSGNSGGPILDSKGQVIGVARSTLSFLKRQKVTAKLGPLREELEFELSLPRKEQNFNIAISHKAVHDFFDELKAEGTIDFTLESSQEAPSLEPEAISKQARDFTVLVQCWN